MSNEVCAAKCAAILADYSAEIARMRVLSRIIKRALNATNPSPPLSNCIMLVNERTKYVREAMIMRKYRWQLVRALRAKGIRIQT